jgi:glutamine synthetase
VLFRSREALSRFEIHRHAWDTRLRMEGECAANLTRTRILPAALHWERELAGSAQTAQAMARGETTRADYYAAAAGRVETLFAALRALEQALAGDDATAIRDAMAPLRVAVDDLEAVTPESAWPLALYRDLLFNL